MTYSNCCYLIVHMEPLRACKVAVFTRSTLNLLGEVTRYYDALCNLTKVVRPNQAGGGEAPSRHPVHLRYHGDLGHDSGSFRQRAVHIQGHREGNVIKEIHPNAVVYSIINSSGVVTDSPKEVARSICGEDVVIPTRSVEQHVALVLKRKLKQV